MITDTVSSKILLMRRVTVGRPTELGPRRAAGRGGRDCLGRACCGYGTELRQDPHPACGRAYACQWVAPAADELMAHGTWHCSAVR